MHPPANANARGPKKERIRYERIVTAAIGAAAGLAIAIVASTLSDPTSAQVGATLGTALAAVVALGVGFVPWTISRNERRTRSAVVAARILHDLEVALRSAETVRDGLGHVAETASAHKIQRSAKMILPMRPETLDETFDRLSAFDTKEALIVCAGVMAAIDLYQGVFYIAELDPEDALEQIKGALTMTPPTDQEGNQLSIDLDNEARRLFGKELKGFARMSAVRAMDAQELIPPALEILRSYGAISPRPWIEGEESPIPEVAKAVREGRWPPPEDRDYHS